MECQIWFNGHWTGYRFTKDLLTSNNHVYMGLGTMHRWVSGHLRRMISWCFDYIAMILDVIPSILCIFAGRKSLHTFHLDKIKILMFSIHVLHFYTNFVPIFLLIFLLKWTQMGHGPFSGGLIGFELVSLLRSRKVREFTVLLRSTFGCSVDLWRRKGRFGAIGEDRWRCQFHEKYHETYHEK